MATTSKADTSGAYAAKTPASHAAWERARRVIPGGVTSNVRFFPPYPIFMDRASGSRIYDVDGREYIDYCLAFGPLVAGHGHPHVLDSIQSELARRGTVLFGASTELELVFAERLKRLIPSAEMVRFTNSGTESTMHAIRLARGATGRGRIVKFEGHYHGGHDSVLIGVDASRPAIPANDGIPPWTTDATVVLPFNDDASLLAVEQLEDVAAVIVEPVARGVIAAERTWLAKLRAITAQRGIVLIFDEVVAWPRVSLAGAQGWLGVTPDLTALGKAVGGGLPMGAIAGRRALMELYVPRGARDEAAGGSSPYVFHGGTYNGTPIALAAGMATLDLLEHGFDGLAARTERMRASLRSMFETRGLPAQVIGHGLAFDFYFTSDAIRSSREIAASDVPRRERVDYRLFEAGIYNSPLHRFHTSLAHSDADLERTLDAIGAAVDP